MIVKAPSVELGKCGDCVSRQAAIDAIWKPIIKPNEMIFDALKQAQQNEIETIPSFEPERKQGKWKYTTHHGRKYRVCSQCGSERIYDHSTGWNYCPCCGERMMEVDE